MALIPPPGPPPSGVAASSGALPAKAAGPGAVPAGPGVGVSSGDRSPEGAMLEFPADWLRARVECQGAAPIKRPPERPAYLRLWRPRFLRFATSRGFSNMVRLSPFSDPGSNNRPVGIRKRHQTSERPAAFPGQARKPGGQRASRLPKNSGAGLPFPKEDYTGRIRGLSRFAALRTLPLRLAVGAALAEMDGQRPGALEALDLIHGLANAGHLKAHAFLDLGARARHPGQLREQAVKIGAWTAHGALCPLCAAR